MNYEVRSHLPSKLDPPLTPLIKGEIVTTIALPNSITTIAPSQKFDRTLSLKPRSHPFKSSITPLQKLDRTSLKSSIAPPYLKVIAFGSEKVSPDLPLPENSVYFYRPPQEQLKDIYASCDAWLFASRLEGFGLPILEAMTCRTPVIATPAGAAPELVNQGAGIVLNSYQPEILLPL